jgi:hypothetical protein
MPATIATTTGLRSVPDGMRSRAASVMRRPSPNSTSALSSLLGILGCDHTKAELPRELVDAREHAPVYLPFRFRLFGGPGDWRMWVGESGVEEIRRGDEILRIDGDRVGDRVDAIWPLMPVDGETTHVRPWTLAESSEFLGSGFDHFDPMLNATAPTVELTVRGRDGEVRRIVADRIGYAAFRELTGESSRWRNFSDPGAVQVDDPQPGTAVLTVSTFVNYRTPVDPADVFDPVFTELRERGIRRLVVDMRLNGGGSTGAQEALIERLIRRPVQTVEAVQVRSLNLDGLREHLSSWTAAAMNPDPDWFVKTGDVWVLRPEFGGAGGPIEPHPLAFDGELVVLTGPVNSSGATTMVGAVREGGDAVLIGQKTGGNQAGSTAGILYYLDLPNSGIRVRVPAQRMVMGFDQIVDGQGYTPDLEIVPSVDDWRSGHDPVLEAALGPLEGLSGSRVDE